MADLNQLATLIKQEGAFVQQLESDISKVIIGQKKMIERILMGLLTGGHILLEGLPGLSKNIGRQKLG
jgi:MoxR-like ATPase